MRRTPIYLLAFSLVIAVFFCGCVSTAPSPSQPISSDAIRATIATGKTKKEVKAALGPPHDKYKDEQWIYIYEDRNRNKYRLDILFGYQDRIILARTKPCKFTEVHGQTEPKCL